MSSVQRVCANCACTETPLWRRSPLGPKTLCNACGVRMKKGRLVFVPHTNRFITVESPAAAAKRQRKEQQQQQRAAKPDGGGNAAVAQGQPQAAAAAAAGMVSEGAGYAPRPGVNKSRRKGVKGKAAGLYYLLAAIEFVETS